MRRGELIAGVVVAAAAGLGLWYLLRSTTPARSTPAPRVPDLAPSSAAAGGGFLSADDVFQDLLAGVQGRISDLVADPLALAGGAA